MSSRSHQDRTTIEFLDLRAPDEELIVNSVARLVERLLPNTAEKMRFCVFLMDHGYELSADQAFELAHVLAEYSDKIVKEKRSALRRKLDIIDGKTRDLETVTPPECSGPSSTKNATESSPNNDTEPLQPQTTALPDPGNRSTYVINTPIPREDGVVDNLWDFVREHGVEVVRQEELGHLMNLLTYYIKIMTKEDGPTPYRVEVSMKGLLGGEIDRSNVNGV